MSKGKIKDRSITRKNAKMGGKRLRAEIRKKGLRSFRNEYDKNTDPTAAICLPDYSEVEKQWNNGMMLVCAVD